MHQKRFGFPFKRYQSSPYGAQIRPQKSFRGIFQWMPIVVGSDSFVARSGTGFCSCTMLFLPDLKVGGRYN